MSVINEQKEQLRYERKFLITDFTHLDIEQMLKFHPSNFSEIYLPRTVNNIYFDTLGFNSYYDNVEGATQRLKVRIRWYGNLFGAVQQPVLEYKIKKGILGKKNSYNLKPFFLDSNFNKSQIINALNSSGVPQNIKDELLSLKPTLLNSYRRKYFLSADKNFRITIDQHLTYYRIGYYGNTFLNKTVDHHSTVLELKYDSLIETEAKKVVNNFPFGMTKNSKYLQGIERIFI